MWLADSWGAGRKNGALELPEAEAAMKYQSLEQISLEADVHAGMGMSRRERLERWAELLERQSNRRLSTIEGAEYGSRREREVHRLVCYCHDGRTVSPGTVAAGLRMMAQQNERATLWSRGMAIGGLSAAAALGLMLLAL